MPRHVHRKFLLSTVLIGLAVCGLFVVGHAEEPTAASVAIKQPDADEQSDADKRADRFAKLEKALSGVALVGHFTVTGGKETKLTEERYELKSVKHLSDDLWTFTARITYGEHDVNLPLTLPVRWAGDTPVITVDKMGFPGLGTYTARVMIYADHYAGFWSGGDHGGHLFGVIDRELQQKE